MLLQFKGFFWNVFCTKAMFTLENVLDEKKKEGGGRGGSCGTSISDLRVVVFNLLNAKVAMI